MTAQALTRRAGLVLDLKVGQSVALDSVNVVITLESKAGRQARLRIEAPKAVAIGQPVWKQPQA